MIRDTSAVEDISASQEEQASNTLPEPLAQSTATESSLPAVLDVGFARVELKRHATWPKLEFYIEALASIITTDGATAVLQFLDFVLHLPEVKSSGFMLTYDLSCWTCPQLDLLGWILRYISDPQREDAWQQRCVCCKVIVPPGMYFTTAESVLSVFFGTCPPLCNVFLTTAADPSKAENWVCFKPEDAAMQSPGILSTLSANFLDALFPAFPLDEQFASCNRETLQMLAKADAQCEDVAADKGKATSASQREAGKCPDFVEVPFAIVSQGFDESANTGYLRIVGKASDGPMTDEGLSQIMDFMDLFVHCPNAQKGFSVTYDIRQLNVPSMSMIMNVADWGKNPYRQDKWMKLNTSCKVVVSAGIRFSMCKAVLKSFFFVCPPVCRTVLVSELDQPEEEGVIWNAPEGSADMKQDEGEAASEEVASEDEAGSSGGHSADASESTSATTSNGAPHDLEVDDTLKTKDELEGRKTPHARDCHMWIAEGFSFQR
jgi:hypothetical protein